MNNWTPIFRCILDSSVWVLPNHIRIVWVTMLALKDADHIVRANAFQIARRAYLTEKEVMEALEVLSSPDTERLEPQEYEGRRIERVPDGWLILNGANYLEVMRKATRRAQQAKWARDHRQLKKGKPLPGEENYVRTYENQGQEAADQQMR